MPEINLHCTDADAARLLAITGKTDVVNAVAQILNNARKPAAKKVKAKAKTAKARAPAKKATTKPKAKARAAKGKSKGKKARIPRV